MYGQEVERKKVEANCYFTWKADAAKYVDFEITENIFGKVNLTIWVHPKAFGFLDFQTAQGVCELTRDALKDILILNITNKVLLRTEIDETDIEDIFSIEDKVDIEDITSIEDEIEVEGNFTSDYVNLIENGNVEETSSVIEGENITDELDVITEETRTKFRSKFSDTHLAGPSIILSRWRQYAIDLTAADPQWEVRAGIGLEGGEETLQLDFNTFRWDCQDIIGTSITQTQFCDGFAHCPNGRDEHKDICQVSQLPRRLSYLSYVYMLIFILGYFRLLTDEDPASESQHIRMIIKQSFKKCLHQKAVSDFKALYVEIHQFGPNFEAFCQEVKYEMYQNPAKVGLISKWVREIEEELHGEAKEIYKCINSNFGGSHYLTTRIVDPEGGVIAKIQAKVNQMMFPRRIRWHFLSNFVMFIMLCLHMFDYVKDIGEMFPFLSFVNLFFSDITAILHHFDRVVVQQSYRPYKVKCFYSNYFCFLLLRVSTSTTFSLLL